MMFFIFYGHMNKGCQLVIFEDELLHSFLFRTQKVFGFSDFRNVISNAGLLRFDIFPLAEMLELYRCFDQQSLYDVISRTGTYLVNRRSFNTPKDTVLKFFVIHMQTPEYKRNQLRNLKSKYNFPSVNFCVSCLAEDVREKGVGYIRYSWIRQVFCPRHKICLHNKIFSNYSDTVVFFNDITSGKIPSYTFQNPTDHLNCAAEVLSHTPVFLMPCVFSKLKPWVETNKKEIAKKAYHSFGFKSAYVFLPGVQYIMGNDLLMNHLYITLINENIAGFYFFLKENFEVTSMKFQDKTHGFFDACVMKTIKHSCQVCVHTKKDDCTNRYIM